MKTFALAVLLLSLAGITSAAQADGAAFGQYAKQSQEDASAGRDSTSGNESSDVNTNGSVNAGDAQLNNTYGVCFPEWTLLEYCYEN